MQPRTLDAILAELSPVYTPQVQNIQKRQALIPGQIADEEKGLDAKKTSAFDSILGGARQRGLGFSGIPLAEQAKYTATDYLPAVARLRSQGRQEALTLEDAILGINERKQTSAMGIRQYEQTRYDQEMARLRQEAEQRRQAAAQAAQYASLMGTRTNGNAGPAPAKGNPDEIWAANSVKKFLDTNNDQQIVSDYNAARNHYIRTGNIGDKYKIIFYQMQRPDIFGKGTPTLPNVQKQQAQWGRTTGDARF